MLRRMERGGNEPEELDTYLGQSNARFSPCFKDTHCIQRPYAEMACEWVQMDHDVTERRSREAHGGRLL